MFPLRYRLLLILIGSALVVLLAYFSIARILFESDKSSVIYDTLFEATQSRAERVENHLHHHFSLAKALMISRQDLRESEAFLYLLRLAPQIQRAWFLRDLHLKNSRLISLSGENLDDTDKKVIDQAFSELDFETLPAQGLRPIESSNLFLAWQKIDGPTEAQASYLTIALRWPELQTWLEGQIGLDFVLADATMNPLWYPMGFKEDGRTIVRELSRSQTRNWQVNPEQLFELGTDSKKVIISTGRIKSADLRLIAIADHAQFFKPLEELRTSSILFIVFVLSIFAIISVFLAKGISKKLEILTASASQVAAGNLDVQVQIQSRDEVGVLAQTFNLMVTRIKDLLVQTAHKARMESELKTAQTVQRTLFPLNTTEHHRVRLAGSYESASECGGDWWYYFKRDHFLYVFQCDATGHGAPAALMTSAARAIVSVIEQAGLTELSDIAKKLSNGLFATSKAELMMTAFLLKLDTQTGKGEFINASHENPILLRAETGEMEFVIEPNNSRLGESENLKFHIGYFQMQKNDQLFVYTDGLFAVENAEKKSVGERRGLKKVCAELKSAPSLEQGLASINTWVREYRGEQLLPDDITMVTLTFS